MTNRYWKLDVEILSCVKNSMEMELLIWPALICHRLLLRKWSSDYLPRAIKVGNFLIYVYFGSVMQLTFSIDAYAVVCDFFN